VYNKNMSIAERLFGKKESKSEAQPKAPEVGPAREQEAQKEKIRQEFTNRLREMLLSKVKMPKIIRSYPDMGGPERDKQSEVEWREAIMKGKLHGDVDAVPYEQTREGERKRPDSMGEVEVDVDGEKKKFLLKASFGIENPNYDPGGDKERYWQTQSVFRLISHSGYELDSLLGGLEKSYDPKLIAEVKAELFKKAAQDTISMFEDTRRKMSFDRMDEAREYDKAANIRRAYLNKRSGPTGAT